MAGVRSVYGEMIVDKETLEKIAVELNTKLGLEPRIDTKLDIVNIQSAINKATSLLNDNDTWMSHRLLLYLYYLTKRMFHCSAKIEHKVKYVWVPLLRAARKAELKRIARIKAREAKALLPKKYSPKVQKVIDLLNEELYSDSEIVSIMSYEFPDFSAEKVQEYIIKFKKEFNL